MIGIVVSMFTALIVTKTLMKLGVNMGLLKTPAHFRVKRGKKMIKVVEKKNMVFNIPYSNISRISFIIH